MAPKSAKSGKNPMSTWVPKAKPTDGSFACGCGNSGQICNSTELAIRFLHLSRERIQKQRADSFCMEADSSNALARFLRGFPHHQQLRRLNRALCSSRYILCWHGWSPPKEKPSDQYGTHLSETRLLSFVQRCSSSASVHVRT